MTVADAVVGGEGDGHDRTWPDRAVDHPSSGDHLAEPDNRDLRRIDDAVERFDAAVAQARYSERGIGKLGATDATGARARHQVAHAAHQVVERELVGVMQRWRGEPAATDRDGDADVHGLGRFELVAAIKAIKNGESAGG